MSSTPHLTLQPPIEPQDQIDRTHHRNVEGLLVVAEAEEEGGQELQDQEQVPHRSHSPEAMEKCMETHHECSTGTKLRLGRSLENGTDTGVSTTSLTLCVFPTLAP